MLHKHPPKQIYLSTLPYRTLPYPTLPYPTQPYPTLPNRTQPYPTLPYPTLPNPTLPYPTLPYPTLPLLSCKEQRMISEIYILFFKASLTIRHTVTVSRKKSGTSKKIQWDFQISRVGSLDFLDLKVNGSPVRPPSLFLKGKPICIYCHASHYSNNKAYTKGI